MAHDYSIVLNPHNYAFKKYYQTYIKNEDNIPHDKALNILGNTCKISEKKINEYNDNIGSLQIHKEYSKLVQHVLIIADDKNAKNIENVSNTGSIMHDENSILIPNEYNTFRDIHYYFTQFCYKIKDGIYEKFLDSVEKHNNIYENCIVDNDLSIYLVGKNRKTFEKILEYMCKFNYKKFIYITILNFI